MKRLNILITGAGAPGIQGTIYSLINNYDKRNFLIVGTDVQEEVVGKYLCHKFYKIPPAKLHDQYLNSILEICRREKIDVFLPQNTSELLLLSENINSFQRIGVKIVISKSAAIESSNNKYHLMNVCRTNDIQVGDFKLVNNKEDLVSFAAKLGWPKNQFVIKPPQSSGMRGVRVIDENYNPKKDFFEEKPNNMIINMDQLLSILGDSFNDLVVTEYLPGDEYTVDVFRNGSYILAIPRRRDLVRTGITFNSILIKNKLIIENTEKLAKLLDLNYCFGFQFKLDPSGTPKILESNPRVQGTMVMSTIAGANIIYSSVKMVLGEDIPELSVNWYCRFMRYWGGIGIVNDNIIKI